MSEEKSSNMFSNAKLSTIFMVVLGLHVVVIVLISAYHLLKGDTSVEMTQRMTPPEPRSYESILTDEADESSPAVVTAYDTADMASTDNSSQHQPHLMSSMPAADDPIWTGQAPVTTDTVPAVAEGINTVSQAATQTEKSARDMMSETTDFRPAPMVVENVNPTITEVKKAQSTVATVTASEYTVKKGDTLTGIASRYGVKVGAIQAANQLNSSMIRIGQKLTLPGVSAIANVKAATVVKAQQAAPKATSVSAGTYKVGKGDTLWKISRKFSTTPQTIADMNGITDPSKLRVGDTLKVPNSSASASAGTVETSTDMAMMPTR